MTAELMTLQVRSRRQWRAWLATHHTSSPGVWLVFYKAHTGVKSIRYEDTVREALCFGWIDSLVKRLDDDRYALKVTPRQPTSKWSDINRKRWVELKAAGLLTSAGLAAAPTNNTYAPRPIIPDLPVYIAKALKANSKAWEFFASWRPPTDVTSSFGFTQLNDWKRAKGAFANRSHCWRPEKSLA